MSLSDRFKSLLNKNSEASSSNKSEKPLLPPASEKTPAEPSSPKPSHTLDELGKIIAQERTDGEAKKQGMENDLQGIRASLEKLELTAKSSRDTQSQTLQFLQQDADREIKFFERKLREDMALWDKQLKDREKALEQAVRQVEAGHLEKKTAYEETGSAEEEAAGRAEALLKEQETKLAEERQKWRDLLQTKENELLTLKQALSRREADLENEFKQQEAQKKAAQELWQTRLKDLERQWAEKRKAWEEAMKAKETERLRLHSSYQEKQAAWQLEQERRIQDVSRRRERAQEKLASLKAHLVKETQNWQQLSQNREEQVQQLKVKLLLSETEAKGRLDQAQKMFQDSVAHITGQIQVLQRQLQEEQETWQKQLEAKDQETRSLQDNVHGKLRQMEADFTQRLSLLNSEKETLNADLNNLQTDYQEAQTRYTRETEKLKEEQTTLENAHQKRMTELKSRDQETNAALQVQITDLEKQKLEAERDLESARLIWQEQLVVKEQALKEVQNIVGPQEEELRKRFTADEEVVTRQVDALKIRLRALERDLARTHENIEKTEKEQEAVSLALESDHRAKEEALRQRSVEQDARLKKRLDERRLALDAFLTMKKDEETRTQTVLKTKEKERAELSTRLQTLPKELEKALHEKKQTVQKESGNLQARIAALEAELAKAREESKIIAQSKATQLASLRQALEQKHKEISSQLRSQEQVLESERAQIEKQMTAAQAEMDRVRSHWQNEIDKKEKEIQTLQDELRKQEVLQRQTLEEEVKKFDEQLKPLEQERQLLGVTLEQHKTQHEEAMKVLESQKAACQAEIQKTMEQERADKAAMETRFREERAQGKARIAALVSEREGVLRGGGQAFDEKTRLVEQLEEQIRAQTVAHEARRRDLIHQATQKTRTLQDIIRQIEHELKTTQDLLPQQIKERETIIAALQQDLIETQTRLQKTRARFERALSTLTRRAHVKEEELRKTLQAVQEEWAKKLADRDAQTAALQSNLLAKESERQGELDRLAKQFAEERFQLEKAKDELEWKLKDRKEISERQLASRQKEIQTIENEIHRAKLARDQEVAQKSSAFEAEKQKLETTLSSLQKQIDETRQTQEAALAAKEQELQTLLARSKEHLRVLSEEFNQKVSSWRATNDSLRAQIEQLKGHVAQAQDNWEALRKEKGNEISGLRQELAQWETRIKTEAEEFERSFTLERQTLIGEVRKQEKDLKETTADYEHRLTTQEEDMVRATEDIRGRENSMEAQWHASLEQWQTDKQSLQQQKSNLEQELVNMQSRFQNELRQMDEAGAKLKMDIAFKETHAAGQSERMKVQMQRELDPLRDRLARLMNDQEKERTEWETRLRAKNDDVKTLKARLASREKRLQEESQRRMGEIEKLRKQVTQDVESARARYQAERSQLEKLLLERRQAIAQLQVREKELLETNDQTSAHAIQTVQKERQALEERLQQAILQREQLRDRYETLLNERDQEADLLSQSLETKEREMTALREKAKDMADALRKKTEALRHVSHQDTFKHGPTNAAAWNAFEAGVSYYQSQNWAEAAHAFEDCLQKDPKWGAAYQYLALTYHAQGNGVRAAEVAVRARELDPGNTQLATWADRLQAQVQERKAS